MAKDIEKILHGCFHPKEGRPNLHKVPVNIERARQHIDKARKNLRAMKIVTDQCYKKSDGRNGKIGTVPQAGV